MKRAILFLIFILSFSLVFGHTQDAELNAEIQKGKELLEKLQKGEIRCQDLTDEDFHSIGEYAMDQMIGGSDHLKMNQIIEQMHGKEGEELMHINMGKRFSGCEKGFGGWMMMMGPMMRGNWNMPMMGFWNWGGWNFVSPIYAFLGIIFLLVVLSLPILVFILLILAVIYLIKKLSKNG